MSRGARWEKIVAALRDGRDETALGIFEELLREERDDAYQDGRDDGRDDRCEEPFDPDLDEAKACLRRGNRAEGLIHLERALGSDFLGLLMGGAE
ncbi:hypothetical protein [Xanthobacter sp.]|uniref:hypothetical protein n=1 Tax=Xanthobacter sp. TaxID=35809 RepID=UPI0025F04AA5|nr:hypothetical protein [Xanthobacter sp.]